MVNFNSKILPITMPIITVVLLLIIKLVFVNSKCITTYINTCDHISDISLHGDLSWDNLLIIPNSDSEEFDVGSTTNFTHGTLKPGDFANVRNVEELYIVENLNEIEPFAFASLEKIQLIRLYKNNIKRLRTDSFSSNGESLLKKVVLSDNYIEDLQAKCFGNSTIAILNLSRNRIGLIRPKVVDGKALKKLDLSENRLTSLNGRIFGSNLIELDVSSNQLIGVAKVVFEELSQLQRLNLSRNCLPSVPHDFGALTSLNTLLTLDLSYNYIMNIEPSALASLTALQELFLNDNRLFYLNPLSLGVQTSIRLLYLHRNHLGGLSGELGSRLSELKWLTIGGNPLVCDNLVMVEQFIQAKGIERSVCEVQFFKGDGQHAVCLGAYDEEFLSDQNNTQIKAGFKCYE